MLYSCTHIATVGVKGLMQHIDITLCNNDIRINLHSICMITRLKLVTWYAFTPRFFGLFVPCGSAFKYFYVTRLTGREKFYRLGL